MTVIIHSEGRGTSLAHLYSFFHTEQSKKEGRWMCLIGVSSLTCIPQTFPFSLFHTYPYFLNSITVCAETEFLTYDPFRGYRVWTASLTKIGTLKISTEEREGNITVTEHVLLLLLLNIYYFSYFRHCAWCFCLTSF